MNKSLVALAVLGAFAGAASAQSSVTLYGQIDVSIGRTSGGAWGINNGEGYATPATGSTNPAVKDGFNSTTMFGFRGSEDLGSGMRANFDLQTAGFDVSNGSGTLFFQREAWAGISSAKAGEVRLGRSSSIATKTMAPFDLNGTSYSSALDRAGISPVTWYGSSRRSDQIQYASPNFAGVVVRLGLTPYGDGISTPQGASGTAKNRTSLGVNYAAGPVAAGAVLESSSVTDGSTRKAFAVGASFDAKVVKVSAVIDRSPRAVAQGQNFWAGTSSGKDPITGTTAAAYNGTSGGKGYALGLVAPIGQANLGLQYARNTESKGKALELFANYALSKRTRLYADYVRTSGEDAVAADAGNIAKPGWTAIPANAKAIALGVVHTF